MSQIIIPFTLAGAAVVLLIGGLLILGHAFKTWVDERRAGLEKRGRTT